LQWLLDTFEYDHILAHLDDDEKFMVEGFDNLEHTSGLRATSDESLDTLTKRLNELTGEYPKVGEKERRVQSITTLAMYHFDQKAGMSLMEGAEVKGKYPFLKILHEGTQLGMLEAETGLFSLTLEGAQRILSAGVYGVEVHEFEIKGDIFAPGVKAADPIIRPNDEIVVFSENNGEKILKAVGRATMSGNSMVEAEKGKAVKVRHYRKQ
jgi:archaeosine synthase